VTITSGLKPVLGTVQATTSGTSKDFTDIPSWVKKITVVFSGVSLSGTAQLLVQLGTSGGLQTTSYTATQAAAADTQTVSVTAFTSGFPVPAGAAARLVSGVLTLVLLDAATGTWVASGTYAQTIWGATGGTKALSGTLDRIRVTTSNGTDTFDAGSVNIMYE
jgi:hypothetical protein